MVLYPYNSERLYWPDGLITDFAGRVLLRRPSDGRLSPMLHPFEGRRSLREAQIISASAVNVVKTALCDPLPILDEGGQAHPLRFYEEGCWQVLSDVDGKWLDISTTRYPQKGDLLLLVRGAKAIAIEVDSFVLPAIRLADGTLIDAIIEKAQYLGNRVWTTKEAREYCSNSS